MESGIFCEDDASVHYRKTCIVFFRSLQNINTSHEKAARFIDKDKMTGNVKEEAQGVELHLIQVWMLVSVFHSESLERYLFRVF